MNFESLNIIEPILKALQEEGYTTPTPIQEKAIPIVLEGKDILACAQTGTGKTAAFAIPVIQLLKQNGNDGSKRKIRCLILSPTRELAIQIDESFKAYGRHTKLISTVIFGGVNQSKQTSTLRNGVDILIATPGRLIDLINQGYINLKDLGIFILDEADRMLDMGFIHDVKKIITLIPQKRQTLFFSATMPDEIVKLSQNILTNPSKIAITPVSSAAETVKQFVYYVDRGNKNKLLIEVLKDKSITSALVFTRTKHGADKVVRVLSDSKIKAEAIHGNKAQNARQRALTNFKNQSTRVLVATDIAARGIDVDDLACVINLDIPNISETYVHRIGRTGRAGISGVAYSFCDAEEKAYLKDIQKLISKSIEEIAEHPFPLQIHNPPPVIRSAGNQRQTNKPNLEKPKRHNKFSRNRRKEIV